MNTKGFTLLEVSLFLAVSGALGLIAFVGLGPRLRNVRFTQSIRLIESTINAQFAASQSGQNNRPANFICQSSGGGLSVSALADNPVGSSEDCVINGKVVYFENNKMTFYSVISRRSPLPVSGVDCLTTSSLSELQRCYTPRLTGTGVRCPTARPSCRRRSLRCCRRCTRRWPKSGRPRRRGQPTRRLPRRAR